MRARRRPPPALLALLALSPACWAQLGGSVALESDYRFRGTSLSNEKPDLRLTLAWDHASGLYLGGSATRYEFRPGEPGTALLGYAGLARELAPGWQWELGVTRTHLSEYAYYDYTEAYLGLLADRGSLRLYLSPDYYGADARTAYLELAWGWPLAPDWRLFAQGGALRRLDQPGIRLDGRLGVTWSAGEGFEWQLAWIAAQRRAPFGVPASQRNSLLWLGSRWSF